MILYFSGTGNSKYVAKRIADALGDEIVNLNARIKASDTSPVETDERLIIVTPTYAWRIPRVVRDWLLKTELRGAKQVWFVMTCGSEIGNADKYNRELCAEKAISCMGTAQIVMPENFIAMFNAPTVEEARRIVAKAEPFIDRAIADYHGTPDTQQLMDALADGAYLTQIGIEDSDTAVVEEAYEYLEKHPITCIDPDDETERAEALRKL